MLYGDFLSEINLGSLGGNDVTVTGPNGFVQNAVLVSTSANTNGTAVTATYRIVPPGGASAFTAANSGQFTIAVNAGSVTDALSNPIAATTVGTFSAVFDSDAPTAEFLGGALLSNFELGVTVRFSDASGFATQDLLGSQISVTSPSGRAVSVQVRNVVESEDGRQLTITYTVLRTDGLAFNGDDSGTYQVALNAGGLRDVEGNVVSAGALGSFAINADTAAPQLIVSGVSTISPDDLFVDVAVELADATGIDEQSVVDGVITLIAPGGTTITGSVVEYSDTEFGAQAIYRFRAPGGFFGVLANGAYSVSYAGGIRDTSGNETPGATLFSFDVALPTPENTADIAAAIGSLGGSLFEPGDRRRMTITVQNSGNTRANSTALVTIYASRDDILDESDQAILSRQVRLRVAPGRSSTVRIDIPVIPGLNLDGEFRLLALVDTGQMSEAYRGNNIAVSEPVQFVAPFVDLATSLSARLPGKVVGGARQAATLTLNNSGNVDYRGPVGVAYYLSSTPELSDDAVPFATETLNARIREGRSQRFSRRLTLPSDVEGDVFLVARANFDGAITDPDSSNNSASVGAFNIAPPFVDLSIDSVTTRSSYRAGRRSTVTFIVRNNGNIDARGVADLVLSGEFNGEPISFTLPRNLRIRPDRTVRLTVPVIPPAEATGTTLTLTATVNLAADATTVNNQLFSEVNIAVA